MTFALFLSFQSISGYSVLELTDIENFASWLLIGALLLKPGYSIAHFHVWTQVIAHF